MSESRRVQAPELRADIRLQPAPIQSDTYAPPPRVATDTRYAALADALSSFSGSLGVLQQSLGIGTEPTEEQKRQQAYEAEMKVAAIPRDQLAAMAASGEIQDMRPEWEARAINAAAGDAYGAKLAEDIRTHLTTEFDWDAGNPDDYIVQKLQEAQQLDAAKDPNFGSSLLRHVQSTRGWAQDYAAKRGVERFTEAKGNAAFLKMDSLVQEGFRNGADAEQIADILFRAQDEFADGVLAVPRDQVVQDTFAIARQNVETNPELTLALLSRERRGKDGQPLNYLTDRATREQALQLNTTALAALDEKTVNNWKSEQLGSTVELLERGDLDQVQDQTFTTGLGKTVTFTAKEQKDMATQAYLQKSQQVAKRMRETPIERETRELRAFRQSGMEHPTLKAELSGVAKMATPDLTQDPEGRQKLINKLEKGRWLRDEAVTSYLAHTDEADRDLIETYAVAQDVLGLDPEQALSVSTRAIRSSKDGLGGLSRDDRDALTRAARNSTDVTWGRDQDPVNQSIIEDRIFKAAMIYKGMGMPMDKAVDTATESVKKTTVVYNGAVLNARTNHLPPNFNEAVDDAILDFSKKAPEIMSANGLDDVSDVTIGEYGTGRFVLLRKNDLTPVRDEDGVVTIDITRLNKASNAKAQKSQLNAARGMSVNTSAKQRGLKKRGDDWYDPKTGEVYTNSFSGDSLAPAWKKTGKRLRNVRLGG
jgi:hypothetical protein